MKLFAEVKGYATIANAEKAATKKGIDLNNSNYSVVVVKDGRFSLAFPINGRVMSQNGMSINGCTPAHMGFCVIG